MMTTTTTIGIIRYLISFSSCFDGIVVDGGGGDVLVIACHRYRLPPACERFNACRCRRAVFSIKLISI